MQREPGPHDARCVHNPQLIGDFIKGPYSPAPQHTTLSGLPASVSRTLDDCPAPAHSCHLSGPPIAGERLLKRMSMRHLSSSDLGMADIEGQGAPNPPLRRSQSRSSASGRRLGWLTLNEAVPGCQVPEQPPLTSTSRSSLQLSADGRPTLGPPPRVSPQQRLVRDSLPACLGIPPCINDDPDCAPTSTDLNLNSNDFDAATSPYVDDGVATESQLLSAHLAMISYSRSNSQTRAPDSASQRPSTTRRRKQSWLSINEAVPCPTLLVLQSAEGSTGSHSTSYSGLHVDTTQPSATSTSSLLAGLHALTTAAVTAATVTAPLLPRTSRASIPWPDDRSHAAPNRSASHTLHTPQQSVTYTPVHSDPHSVNSLIPLYPHGSVGSVSADDTRRASAPRLASSLSTSSVVSPLIKLQNFLSNNAPGLTGAHKAASASGLQQGHVSEGGLGPQYTGQQTLSCRLPLLPVSPLQPAGLLDASAGHGSPNASRRRVVQGPVVGERGVSGGGSGEAVSPSSVSSSSVRIVYQGTCMATAP